MANTGSGTATAKGAAAQDHNANEGAAQEVAKQLTTILDDFIFTGAIANPEEREEMSSKLADARTVLFEEVLADVRAAVLQHDGPFQAMKSMADDCDKIRAGNTSQLNAAVNSGNSDTKGN